MVVRVMCMKVVWGGAAPRAGEVARVWVGSVGVGVAHTVDVLTLVNDPPPPPPPHSPPVPLPSCRYLSLPPSPPPPHALPPHSVVVCPVRFSL